LVVLRASWRIATCPIPVFACSRPFAEFVTHLWSVVGERTASSRRGKTIELCLRSANTGDKIGEEADNNCFTSPLAPSNWGIGTAASLLFNAVGAMPSHRLCESTQSRRVTPNAPVGTSTRLSSPLRRSFNDQMATKRYRPAGSASALALSLATSWRKSV
jgi:hypothetical protein